MFKEYENHNYKFLKEDMIDEGVWGRLKGKAQA